MNIVNNILLNAIIVILITVSSFYLGLLAYRENRKSSSNRIFARFAIATALWILLAFIPDVPYFRGIALISAKLNYLALLVVGFTLIELPFYFPHERRINPYLKYPILGIAVILGILTLFTDKVIAGLSFFEWGTSYVDGEFAGPIYLYMMLAPIISFIQYVFLWKKIDQQDKRRVKLFLMGLFIFMAVNIIAQSIVEPLITHTDEFYKIGNYSAIFMIVLTSYAIVKYELFNIKVLATEIITVALWVILFSKILVSTSLTETIVNSSIFILVLVFGILLVRSVMNEVRQREKLAELNEKLKALDKQKDEFISMAAHELRSPLTAIKGYVSMIIEGDTGDIPEKAREFLADAQAVTDRLVRLVNNMLNVSRIEEGRLVYQLETTSLIRAVQEIYFAFRVEAERKGLKITMDIPDGIKDQVYVDPDRVREVISNLVSNAIKFTVKGSVTIKMRNPTPGTVKVEVIDTGPGISTEEQVKLFQKFYRAESTAGKTFGTGLGLYITRLLIEKFGGKIGVESQVDRGSNFWFELPVSKGATIK
ncbi:hypothetical protein A3A76_04290 [Candidatus Woesebacteria bacterium RIFCSPLOWO2_01_FULL_39_23]|uniref:histidine kinase n=1 Tax=Candidatus Woesebacteria bacterium RIFCSPHIGHO2_01_FULL_40_22 TaxID=1802499 RepID=A0A1F7YFB4_9BACT|nr:MAG: hypothetical protein A2141_01855 [Candidatus Woesebacteria bacterium RBG_16_40_11]OGM25972.1 MAG: hypothetical protein A2628_00290 [Candidatus Woesebacteria bacterium RIFCSPHIGHO2_01_FULL_40_22]OGM38084.1 MAG: hypothetical protein A3E41_03375 [Candidatus Woesebacteria bacterium RIFCSPHIGHO2_12_FULL_38_9]OGM61821.1 MAG: hypothetical protein A3A76_04290 [Candidatus Woesebacteria bacterium RIFCSPLOWO2_01_FULL_39_23]